MVKILRRIAFIAPLLIFKGEDELEALAAGGVLVFNQDEALKKY
jgi:butyrate kinase